MATRLFVTLQLLLLAAVTVSVTHGQFLIGTEYCRPSATGATLTVCTVDYNVRCCPEQNPPVCPIMQTWTPGSALFPGGPVFPSMCVSRVLISYTSFAASERIGVTTFPISGFPAHPSTAHNKMYYSISSSSTVLRFVANVAGSAVDVAKMKYTFCISASSYCSTDRVVDIVSTGTIDYNGFTMNTYRCTVESPQISWSSSTIITWRVRIYPGGVFDDRTDFWEFSIQQQPPSSTTTTTPTPSTRPPSTVPGATTPPTTTTTTTTPTTTIAPIAWLPESFVCPTGQTYDATFLECMPSTVPRTCPYLYERRASGSDACSSIEASPQTNIRFESFFILYSPMNTQSLETVVFSGHPSRLELSALPAPAFSTGTLRFVMTTGVLIGFPQRISIEVNNVAVDLLCALQQPARPAALAASRDMYDCIQTLVPFSFSTTTLIRVRPFGAVFGFRDFWQGTIGAYSPPTEPPTTTPPIGQNTTTSSPTPTAPTNDTTPSTTTSRLIVNTNFTVVISTSSDPEPIDLTVVMYIGAAITAGAIALYALSYAQRKCSNW